MVRVARSDFTEHYLCKFRATQNLLHIRRVKPVTRYAYLNDAGAFCNFRWQPVARKFVQIILLWSCNFIRAVQYGYDGTTRLLANQGQRTLLRAGNSIDRVLEGLVGSVSVRVGRIDLQSNDIGHVRDMSVEKSAKWRGKARYFEFD